jgi:hypothetical protein
MTFSATKANTLKSEMDNLDTLSRGTRAYFQARTKNRLFDLIVTKFKERQQAENLTKAQLARRMGTRPEVVGRMLASPSNLRIDTISDLLLAIAGEELDATSSSPVTRPKRNFRYRDSVLDPANSNIRDNASKAITTLEWSK